MFTVYSKPGCPFCEKFKKVLDIEGLPSLILELNEDYTYEEFYELFGNCLLYTSPSPRDGHQSRMPSSA